MIALPWHSRHVPGPGPAASGLGHAAFAAGILWSRFFHTLHLSMLRLSYIRLGQAPLYHAGTSHRDRLCQATVPH